MRLNLSPSMLVAMSVMLCGSWAAQAASGPPSAGSPTASSTQPSSDEIAALVSQLSAPNWNQRRQAQEKLTAMGELAESGLRRAAGDAGLNPEARKAVELLLGRIETARMQARDLITLNLKSSQATDVYAALAKQAGAQFSPRTLTLLKELGPIDVDVEKQSFWGALSQINRNAGLTFDSIDSAGAIELDKLPKGMLPAPLAASVPGMVTINRIDINVTRGRDFVGQRPMNVRNNVFQNPPCRLYLFGWAEPKRKPICWSVDSIECLLDTGDSLTPLLRGFRSLASNRINTRNDTMLGLQGPVEGAKEIKSLRIKTRFIFEVKREVLDIPNILSVHNATYDLGGFRLVIKDVNKVNEGRYACAVSVYRDDKSPSEWERMRMLLDSFPCKLVDDKAAPLQFAGGGGGYNPNEWYINRNLTCDGANGAKTGEPARFVWEFPTQVEEYVAPLEFKNIPLP